MRHVSFDILGTDGTETRQLEFEHLFIIGYAGRDMEKTMEHIEELEQQLGVAPPKRIPTIFECSHEQLTQAKRVLFVGNNTCGEVEPVLIYQDGDYYIGVGSDHTDRQLESISVLKSKQICAKPISQNLWKYEDVKDHWDQIHLKSYQEVEGERIEYQAGLVSDILPLEKIMEELKGRVEPFDKAIILCGTVPLLDGFTYGSAFIGEMYDPVLDRSLEVSYRISVITEEER